MTAVRRCGRGRALAQLLDYKLRVDQDANERWRLQGGQRRRGWEQRLTPPKNAQEVGRKQDRDEGQEEQVDVVVIRSPERLIRKCMEGTSWV
jgi:hypothetical protein